jgi:SAM-dependent methyltransferase
VAIEQYRRAAPGYDRHMRRYARWQRMAVDRLELTPGQSVIDVACGTGLNFPLLRESVGGQGLVVGIDLSPEMIAIARGRIAAEGWDNVELVEAAVEDAPLKLTADAALFSFSHDVLQSAPAVGNVVAHLRPGGRVASVGAKLADPWNPVNFFVRRAARPYLTTLDGLDRPWRGLEHYTGQMHSKSLALGGAHLAWGRVTADGVAIAAEQPGRR